MEKPTIFDGKKNDDVQHEKRKRWRRVDVLAMLKILKNSNFVELMHGKPLRNKAIFMHVQKELKKVGVAKTPQQIRAKFKVMKIQYFKTKRQCAISGIDKRNECEYYDLLHEILDHGGKTAASDEEGIDSGTEEFLDAADPKTSAKTAAAELTTTTEIDEIVIKEENESENFDLLQDYIDYQASASEDDWPKEELIDVDDCSTSGTAISTPTPAAETTTTTTTTAETKKTKTATAESAASALKTFRTARKRTYQQTIASFTDEWNKTQKDMMQRFTSQQQELMTDLRRNDNKLISELDKILEKDRLETIKALKKLLP